MAVNEYKTKDHHYDQTTKKDMLRQKIKEIFRQHFTTVEALDILDEIEQKTKIKIQMSSSLKEDLEGNSKIWLGQKMEEEIMRKEEKQIIE